jgi:hypothetical protein
MMNSYRLRDRVSRKILQRAWPFVALPCLAISGCAGYTSSKSRPAGTLSVSITSPSSGVAISGTVMVSATTSDSAAISNVQFQVDGSNIGAAVPASPYSQSWNTSTVTNGKHNLTAVASDTAGYNSTSATVSVTVNNANSPLVAVSMSSPLSDAVIAGTVAVTASASAQHGVTGVQFLLDGVAFGSELTSAPYSASWDSTKVPDGRHTLSARASDTVGNSATADEAVTVSNSSATIGKGWKKLTGTMLTGGSENVSPCPPNGFNNYPYNFVTNCVNVLEDPSSAIADTTRNRLLLWGGGHADYAGNEIYSLQLNCAISGTCPALIRLDPPAPPLPVGATGTNETLLPCILPPGCFPSGSTPNARHLYDGAAYIPSLDIVIQIGGALWPNGFSGQDIWHLAANSVNSTCAPNCDPSWTKIPTSFPSSVGITTGYDSSTGLVWVTNQNNLFSYDPSTKVVTNRGSAPQNYYFTGVFDPLHRYLIEIGPEANPVLYYDIASGTPNSQHVPATTGCSALNGGKGSGGPGGQGTQYPGVAWDPISNRVIVYLNGGNALYLLDPATWTCTVELHGSVQGVDYPQNTLIPSGSAAAGTFKKFSYFPNLDVFALCNDPEKDCWTLKRR